MHKLKKLRAYDDDEEEYDVLKNKQKIAKKIEKLNKELDL